MPIGFDDKPGSANVKQRTRAGEVPVVKESTEPAPVIPTRRIRMLRDIQARIGTFRAGQSVTLEQNLASSLIGYGFAEEDKSLDGMPETKENGPRPRRPRRG